MLQECGLAHDPIFFKTEKILMKCIWMSFPVKPSCSWPEVSGSEKWNFERIYGWVFQDLPTRFNESWTEKDLIWPEIIKWHQNCMSWIMLCLSCSKLKEKFHHPTSKYSQNLIMMRFNSNFRVKMAKEQPTVNLVEFSTAIRDRLLNLISWAKAVPGKLLWISAFAAH